MKKMIIKRRNLLSIALVLLLVAITTLTFAYWDQLTQDKNGTINIGEGQTVTVEDVVISEKKLIPTGAVKGEGDTYEIEVEYTVKLAKLGVNESDKLQVKLVNVKIGENEELGSNYVNVFFGDSETKTNVDGTYDLNELALSMSVKVKFTLSEPNEEDYPKVKGNQITYKLEFSYVQGN